jgi:LysM repeat protein
MKNRIILSLILAFTIQFSNAQMYYPCQNGFLTYEVMPKETLYSITKRFHISKKDFKDANTDTNKEDLQIGQKILIPINDANKKFCDPNPKKVGFHIVAPKETKYAIAKQYGISIEALEKLNPEIVTNLPIGYRLVLTEAEAKKHDAAVTQTTISANASKMMDYTIEPKETLYSLSKKFNISMEQLVELNPILENAVNIGSVIKVPNNTATAVMTKTEIEKPKFDLPKPKKPKGQKERLVMLMPFNLNTIRVDSTNTLAKRMSEDKFMNIVLDYYSGALMALDSAKTLRMPIDVEIYDSSETKSSSNIEQLITKHHFENASAIIGPFYQSNAEETARLLQDTQVPVISPLSKDVGSQNITNLFQSVPTAERLKNAMFNFIKNKNGNALAIVDKKKISILEYLQTNQPDVPLVAFKNGYSIDDVSLKSLLVKGKTNYVVMETANTGMIKSVIANLLAQQPYYDIQLVILENNDTLFTDEIKFQNLVKLKLMYPSVTRENESDQAQIFKKEYKKANYSMPSTYATRGFDVTFDILQRLTRAADFQESIINKVSTQIYNQFDYQSKPDGGYINQGVFILYYDNDLSIKVAE